MSQLVSRIRSLRASKLGRYIPGNKVLAGALAGAVTLEAHAQGVHLPVSAGAIALGAAAVVGYLLPESPVVAGHVIAKTFVNGFVANVPVTTYKTKTLLTVTDANITLAPPIASTPPVPSQAVPTGDGEPKQATPSPSVAADVPNAVDNGPLDVVAPTPAPGGSAQVPPAGPGA